MARPEISTRRSRFFFVAFTMAPPTPQTPTKRRQPAPRSPGTPRRRKYPAAIRLQGVKPDPLTAAQIKEKLIKRLKLAFEPDQWQVEIISRIRQGYDSIFTAGTGYGKSLIFEGLAALGGKNKKLVVVTPIKALERDQVSSPSFLNHMASNKPFVGQTS